MSRDWDARARKNAFHYIASWQKEWDLESFLASGEIDFERLVVPVLARCGLPTTGKRMLELGCGAGRMTASFAKRFEHVYAFDISREMLSRARQMHTDQRNILWLLSNGADLSCVASDSMDFVFSYLVLQHLPEEALALQYIREMLRVLRPGGAFLFQFNGGFEPTMNWRGRLAWEVVDALWAARHCAMIFGSSRLRRRTVSRGDRSRIPPRTWRRAPGRNSTAACVERTAPVLHGSPARPG